ncbi:MAG: hypothetical protein N2V78_09165 [Methanophagales archaeon]|nr:hypothetical protein [Methanophagales archaeon]
MKKKIRFDCWSCRSTFRTRNWSINIFKDNPLEIPHINMEAACPKCGRFCYKFFSLSEIIEIVFETEEKLNELEKKVK